MLKRVLCIALLAVAQAYFLVGCSQNKPPENKPAPGIPFEHVIIDSNPPQDQWCITVGDINGDGLIDVITTGSNPGKGGMVWYEYPTWAKHVIDATGGFSDDIQAVDVDGDGDLDLVVPEVASHQVRWYENPRPKGNAASDPWKIHAIGDYSKFEFRCAHDVEVGDLNGDGKVDVIISNQKWEPPRPVNKPETVIYFQNRPDSWTPVMISRTYGEGTFIADVNEDGRPDIVRPGFWLENPKDPVRGKWIEHSIVEGWPDRAGVAVADFNKDGRLDVVLSAAETTWRLSWFEAPADRAGGKWIEHVIDPSVDYVHTFKVADIDSDGNLDVVFAEMQQSTRKRVGFYLNQGKGLNWKQQVVGTTGSHNIRVADIDADGDFDIVGANWNTATDPHHAPTEMWRNLLKDNRPPAPPK